MSSFSDPILWPSSVGVEPTSTHLRATTAKRPTTKKTKESDTILLVEESILDDEWSKALITNFLSLDEPMPSTTTITASASIPSISLQQVQPQDDRRLRFKSLITPMAGLFQWMKIPQNADHKDWFYPQHLPHIFNMHAIIANSEEFCRLSLDMIDEVAFPSLDSWIENLILKVKQHSFQPKSDEPPRIVLLFYDLDKQVTKVQKKLNKEAQNPTRVMTEIIDWSFAHLLLMYDIEIVRCKGLSETCEYLHTMTRSLESQLERPLTAFNCVNKAMRQKAGDELAGAQKEKFMLNQTWMAMMQMIPNMSKDRAMSAASNSQFSSVKKVYEAMNDSSKCKKERKLLMQSTFGGKRDRNGNILNKHPKLARSIFRLMTEHDREKNVGDDSDGEMSDAGQSIASSSAVPSASRAQTKKTRKPKDQTAPEASVAVAIVSALAPVVEEAASLDSFDVYDTYDYGGFYEDEDYSNLPIES